MAAAAALAGLGLSSAFEGPPIVRVNESTTLDTNDSNNEPTFIGTAGDLLLLLLSDCPVSIAFVIVADVEIVAPCDVGAAGGADESAAERAGTSARRESNCWYTIAAYFNLAAAVLFADAAVEEDEAAAPGGGGCGCGSACAGVCA